MLVRIFILIIATTIMLIGNFVLTAIASSASSAGLSQPQVSLSADLMLTMDSDMPGVPVGVSPRPPSAADVQALKEAEKIYKQARVSDMKVRKTLRIQLLGKETISTGHLWISKSKMKMEIDSPDKSMVLVTPLKTWVVEYPMPEFPDEPAQVFIIGDDLKSKKHTNSKTQHSHAESKDRVLKKSQITTLLERGILNQFFIVGVVNQAASSSPAAVPTASLSSGLCTMPNPKASNCGQSGSKASSEKGKILIYSLQPRRPEPDMQRMQLKLDPVNHQILELSFWDQKKNQTRFEFSEVRFNNQVDSDFFSYSPPSNAKVTYY